MRNLFLIAIVIITGLTFIGRLIHLQILDSSYTSLSRNNAVKMIYDYPERGYIYDRNNKLLVGNQPSYDLMIIPRELKSFDTLELCHLIRLPKKQLIRKIQKAKRYSSRLPSLIVPQLTKKEYAYLQEILFRYKGF